jgi:hypothetical protein
MISNSTNGLTLARTSHSLLQLQVPQTGLIPPLIQSYISPFHKIWNGNLFLAKVETAIPTEA